MTSGVGLIVLLFVLILFFALAGGLFVNHWLFVILLLVFLLVFFL